MLEYDEKLKDLPQVFRSTSAAKRAPAPSGEGGREEGREE
jgi:hypothetical protein